MCTDISIFKNVFQYINTNQINDSPTVNRDHPSAMANEDNNYGVHKLKDITHGGVLYPY